jgi:hypothetical protein
MYVCCMNVARKEISANAEGEAIFVDRQLRWASGRESRRAWKASIGVLVKALRRMLAVVVTFYKRVKRYGCPSDNKK